MKIDYFVVVVTFVIGLLFAYLGYILGALEGSTTAVVLYVGSMIVGKLSYND